MGKSLALLLLSSSVIVAWSLSSPSWQDIDSSSVSRDTYLDWPPTAFAPSGRLYCVEKALEEVNDDVGEEATVAVALKCRDGIVVVCTMPNSPYVYYDQKGATNVTLEEDKGNDSSSSMSLSSSVLLWDEENNLSAAAPPFAHLSPGLFGVTGGNTIDSQILRTKLHLLAASGRYDEDAVTVQSCSASVLARRWADQCQLRTQQSGKGRLLVAGSLIMSTNEIWRVDPNGQFYNCLAAVVGRGAVAVEHELLTKISQQLEKKNSKLAESPSPQKCSRPSPELVQTFLSQCTAEESLHLATQCILTVLGSGENSRKNVDGKHANGQRGSSLSRLRLRGLVISKPKERWYSQKELLSI